MSCALPYDSLDLPSVKPGHLPGQLLCCHGEDDNVTWLQDNSCRLLSTPRPGQRAYSTCNFVKCEKQSRWALHRLCSYNIRVNCQQRDLEQRKE